jgi:MscS family membrane protein
MPLRVRAYGPSRLTLSLASLIALLCLAPGQAQTVQPPSSPPASATAPEDPLGRSTPRGTVLGFLDAARRGENELAREYLDTRLSGRAAADLVQQLFVVLDTRLPARLTQLSDAHDGSRTNPLEPNLERIGKVESAAGEVDVFLERVKQGSGERIWLFSTRTLAAVPALHQEVTENQRERILPRLLGDTRLASVRALQWLSVLLGVVAVYILTTLINRALSPIVRKVLQQAFGSDVVFARDILPRPARLLLIAFVGRWVLSLLPLSLVVRQFWSNAAGLLAIVSITWLLLLLNGRIEEYLARRLPGPGVAAAVALLRLGRRAVDVLLIFVGLLATLRHFGIDPTPALAGLGVGGIAVALAAQKTLENVIAGASLVFDQAVRVGDFLRVGTIEGTVDHIGLRSTRIRTVDRTMVSVPNSQIANMSLETFSARDKFWFHPTIGLRYETTTDQLKTVVNGIRQLLREHPSVDGPSVRVRFVRLGAFSLDVEVFAYLFARDWPHFLELQEALLFQLADAVARAGAEIAFPSQTMYVRNTAEAAPLGRVQSR